VFGRIDHFTIHFQPSGFHRLFGVLMTELADVALDAHAVIGCTLPSVEQELGDAAGFVERVRVIERRLIALLRDHGCSDPVACAANRLFATHGILRVSAMAADCGLSTRQFERRFLAEVGVSPKLYARIIRFYAALDGKLRHPDRAWSRIASERDYHDQMHFVHDCRDLTGEAPSRFLSRIQALPEFHTLFATADRPRRD
jgi:AraC-like DNA-binding protein